MSDTTTSPAELKAQLAKAMPERELQENVRQLCKSINALYYHTHNSQRSPSGFPDCVIVTEDRRLIFAELKREGKDPTTEQKVWLDALASMAVSDFGDELETPNHVFIWRPTQWLDGTIERVLRGKTT